MSGAQLSLFVDIPCLQIAHIRYVRKVKASHDSEQFQHLYKSHFL